MPLFNSLVQELWTAKSGLQLLETSPYHSVHNIFLRSEPVRCGSPVWQQKGRINDNKWQELTNIESLTLTWYLQM